MRFAFLWAGALLGSLAWFGCSAAELEYTSGGGGEADNVDPETIDAVIKFDGASTIDLAPGEFRELTVLTSPAKPYEMYFALLNAPGDASLDASHLFADNDGRAVVNLHAPNAPSMFSVRAWIKNGPLAEITVNVSKQGIGVVEVVPSYGGSRPVTEWVGSVIAGASCAELADQLPGEPNGALVAVAPAPENPVVQSVPVGPKLAVAVRAGHYAWGCADAYNINAGTSTKIKVHVVDVPAALDQTNLNISLITSSQWQKSSGVVENAVAEFSDGFTPPMQSEAAALLGVMELFAPDPQAFATARYDLAWDEVADAHFAALSKPLAEQMYTWINAGLAADTPALQGRLQAIDDAPGKALFLMDSIGGLNADAAGAPDAHIVSWKSAPNDNVFLSGTLFWLPSRFVAAACRTGAELEIGAPVAMADLLSTHAACAELSVSMVGYEGCDADCLKAMCTSALGFMWESAANASAYSGTIGTIDIGASGKLTVDDVAAPVTLEGSWIGTVSDGFVDVSIEGAVSGEVVETDPGGGDPPADDPPQ
ncbi:MAG: hypothetical protein IPK82_11300 [Polyangiaceae bacterium]|nr:hypothetical protein [Polyangiaceae bacterium]